MATKVYGACPHDCPDTCGVVTEVENGRAVNFYANPDHPITQGWLCAKVRPYLDWVYHPERLQYPLRRVGAKGSGQWERISWEEAIAEIVMRWKDIIDEYGAEAILPYSYSGTLGLIQMVVASSRFWNRLGASQLERSICGAAAELAVNMTLGARQAPRYEDVVHNKLIVIWGHNPVSTAPHFMPHLTEARRNGTRVIVIDPRRTRTAKQADWHIAPRPGTDGALALGVAHVIMREGWLDKTWLAEHTVGWEAFRERVKEFDPGRVAHITQLPEETIIELARQYATTKPSLIKMADGVNRNLNGGQGVRAICALPALVGQYGVLGAGLAYSTSGYYDWDWEVLSKAGECARLGVVPGRVVNMNRLGAGLLGEVNDPPIKSLFVFGANPAAISPNAGKIVEGLQREDLFTVVHELFLTDTADYADIVLPATSQLEQADLNRGYGHTYFSYNHPAIAPLGESKSNWDVMRLLAKGMGFSETWLQDDVDRILAEALTATAEANPFFAGITLERLKQKPYIELNLPSRIPFAGGQFPTPSGKVELFSQQMADMGLEPVPNWREVYDDGGVNGHNPFNPDLGLDLISGASHHFVSSSLGNHPSLRQKAGVPFVEVNPVDAEVRGIRPGDKVIVENGRGWCELVAKVTEAIRPGVVSAPKGYWNKHNNGRNINWLTSDELADMAGQSTFHSTRVWLRPL